MDTTSSFPTLVSERGWLAIDSPVLEVDAGLGADVVTVVLFGCRAGSDSTIRGSDVGKLGAGEAPELVEVDLGAEVVLL